MYIAAQWGRGENSVHIIHVQVPGDVYDAC